MGTTKRNPGKSLKCGLCICLDLLQYWNRKEEKRRLALGERETQSESAIEFSHSSRPLFELAEHFLEEGVDVVLFSTAEPLYDEYDASEYLREVIGIEDPLQDKKVYDYP